VKEKDVPYLKAESYVRAGEKSDVGFEVQAALRSPFGVGEHVRISSITTAAGIKEYLAELKIPHLGGNWEVRAKAGKEQSQTWQSYQQSAQSIQIHYHPQTDSNHQFIAEYSLRDEIPNSGKAEKSSLEQDEGSGMMSNLLAGPLAPKGSKSVVHQASASSKASFKHLWTIVDDQKMEKEGQNCFLQTSTELAMGGKGSAQFFKTEVNSRYEKQLGPSIYSQPGLTFSIAGSLGLLYPFHMLRNSNMRLPYLSDRFSLGGPLSLRGFGCGGIGPRDQDRGDSLGGDTKSNLVALLSVPVPVQSLAAATVRAFVFVNFGTLSLNSYWRQRPTNILGYIPRFGALRSSVGAGLSMNVNNVFRVEATYGLPWLRSSQDVVNSFQVGVGVSLN
jgi:outer membrane protein assembly factor BamA